MTRTAPTETLELTDPRAMRALAHPVRIAILELLHVTGTANATECAREVGESAQACSYHLRALAKWGLVRTAPSNDGRESRWELAAHAITFSSGSDWSPEFDAAARLLKTSVLDRDDRIVAEFLRREHELETEWRDAASFTTAIVYPTVEELRELEQQVHQLANKYKRRTKPERPEGARRVDIVFGAIPKVGE